MKDIYLLVHLAPYNEDLGWGPLPVEENQKVKVQEKLEKELPPEIETGRALVAVVDGGVSRLERTLGSLVCFRFSRFPTDDEVRKFNTILEGDEYRLIPAGHDSCECVRDIVGSLLYGEKYRSSRKELDLTVRLNVDPENLVIVPELLVPQIESMNFSSY